MILRPHSPATAYAVMLAILVGIHLTLILALPVMPGQDFPQHLAYVRILVDYGDPSAPFRDLYQIAGTPQPYFVTYYALAILADHVGVLVAFKIVLGVYAIATFASFHFLVVAAHRRTGTDVPPWTGLLATVLVWSPVACMGFLSFMLAVPLVLTGTAALLLHLESPERLVPKAILVASSALLVSLHAVAAGCLLFIALVVLANRRAPRPWRAAGIVCVTMLVTHLAWSFAGTTGLGSWDRLAEAGEAMREAHGLGVLDKLFGIQWSSPLDKLDYVLWTVLGPYRWSGLVFVAVLAFALAVCVRRARRGETNVDGEVPRHRRVHRRIAIGLSALAVLAPWALYVPSEITFLNFRLMTVAFAVSLALIPPGWFHPRVARFALVGFCVLATAHLVYRAVRFNQEAEAPLRLQERASPPGMLMSLPFHDRSDHFAKQFRLTHFLPMYYTVRQRGANTQFWARYTDHLPVGYRAGKRPRHTTDWSPWEFGTADLVDSDYLLLQRADDSDPTRRREGSAQAEETLARVAQLVECDGRWCLYRLR